jgi:hypothetical protein
VSCRSKGASSLRKKRKEKKGNREKRKGKYDLAIREV